MGPQGQCHHPSLPGEGGGCGEEQGRRGLRVMSSEASPHPPREIHGVGQGRDQDVEQDSGKESCRESPAPPSDFPPFSLPGELPSPPTRSLFSAHPSFLPLTPHSGPLPASSHHSHPASTPR